MKKTKGFTLVELLVVMAIIGVLAAIVIVNLNESQKRSRDSRRKSDLNTILTGMMLYYDDHNTFSLSGCNCGYNNEGRGWFNYVGGAYTTSIAEYLKSSNYLNNIIIDPSGDTSCSGTNGSCETNDQHTYMLHYDMNHTPSKKVTVYARMESTKSTNDINNSCSTSYYSVPAISPAGTLYCDEYENHYSLTTTK